MSFLLFKFIFSSSLSFQCNLPSSNLTTGDKSYSTFAVQYTCSCPIRTSSVRIGSRERSGSESESRSNPQGTYIFTGYKKRKRIFCTVFTIFSHFLRLYKNIFNVKKWLWWLCPCGFKNLEIKLIESKIKSDVKRTWPSSEFEAVGIFEISRLVLKILPKQFLFF